MCKRDKSLRSRNVRDNGFVLSFVSRCLLLSSLLILISCSTHKARWGNIQYHNTTCHYNVWWNGNESLKEGRKTLATTAVDDYTRLLPPEQLGTEENAHSIYPQMDRAIEKGIKGIKKHSIYLKGVEHVPYIKECYLKILPIPVTMHKTVHNALDTLNNAVCKRLVYLNGE